MKNFIRGAVVVILAGLLWVGIFHHQEIKDQYIARTVTLSSEVNAVHDKLQLTKRGSLLFRASNPEILSAESFNAACQQVSKELTIVLGCYTRQRFYVYDVHDERLKGIKEVTAAHELLHAVYERLSTKEKGSLGPLLKKTAAAINDTRFQETIATYQKAEPAHVENELYSILGTEIAILPKELEDHYARYFKNRSIVVAYTEAYEATFTQIETQINQYDTELEAYAAQKEQLETSLAVQQRDLEAQRRDMAALQSSGNVREYNALVPEFNQRVRRYNQDIATLQSVVAAYNELVEERNKLAMTQQELLHHMDSTYQPLR